MKDLPKPLHIGEEGILKILNVLGIEHLLYEVLYLNKFIEEEFMLKVGLSFQAGRSNARLLKKFSKVLSHVPQLQRVIEDFKKFITFKIIIQDHVLETHDHLYDVEVKSLE
ncbi:hypothetical protein IEQ34_018283 [Dendrobium chrysotoxum]|uniref:Uncharacterized protein n=1 Tax=Dendrobium chrysotoxum TaxID=161865 RepID=A0AAV7FWI0_DENCH|nr:hypothetical protein IEQ34_018283 [Dendrobium chrysotoxum]